MRNTVTLIEVYQSFLFTFIGPKYSRVQVRSSPCAPRAPNKSPFSLVILIMVCPLGIFPPHLIFPNLHTLQGQLNSPSSRRPRSPSHSKVMSLFSKLSTITTGNCEYHYQFVYKLIVLQLITFIYSTNLKYLLWASTVLRAGEIAANSSGFFTSKGSSWGGFYSCFQKSSCKDRGWYSVLNT